MGNGPIFTYGWFGVILAVLMLIVSMFMNIDKYTVQTLWGKLILHSGYYFMDM